MTFTFSISVGVLIVYKIYVHKRAIYIKTFAATLFDTHKENGFSIAY